MNPFVVLTRPAGRNEALAQRLARAGLDALALPALEVAPLPEPAAGWPVPEDYDLAVFVSGTAVRYYVDALRGRRGEFRWPSLCRAAAVGAATARVLAASGAPGMAQVIHPDASGPQDSEALWGLLQGRAWRRALILRGQTGREWLGQQLQQAGAQVHRCALYRRSAAAWPAAQLQALHQRMAAGAAPVCVFTSAEGVQAYASNIARAGLPEFWRRSRYVAIHERVAQRLRAVLAQAAGTEPDPMVKICPPDDDAVFEAVLSIATPQGIQSSP
ncbi:uroporphyrinogen-III synthase [Candidimonas nitroreducens]|uniref:Uroporphyrinogen-III synthase n=1 Tax=Candidimonas nitroreducens TaxID=683354 RepID=A0A225LZ52_9BURK|nr:uroporphyrinogen-III synthase [Candidimonas nitroreducens]OWT54444.1 uroporphyrinogen-III synthase [Candidimonas nitroreducens]